MRSMTLASGVLFIAMLCWPYLQAAPVPKPKRPDYRTLLQGKWQVIQRIDDGKDRGTGIENTFWTFKEDKCSFGGKEWNDVILDDTHDPHILDLKSGTGVYHGLCEIDGDTLKWMNSEPNGKRPEAMTGKGYLIIFRRVKE